MIEKIKRGINSFSKVYANQPIVGAGLVFVVCFVLFGSVYFNGDGVVATDDHFFHFKYAYLIRTEGLDVIKDFDWIKLTKNVQEHDGFPATLFNFALIPFTFFKDLLFGLKVSDVFWGSFSIAIIYWVFRKWGLRWTFLSVLGMLAMPIFAQRMLLGRGLVLAIGFIFLELYFAKEKKHWKFFLVSLVHVFWHPSTAFMPLIVALIVEVSRYLSLKKNSWEMILASIAVIFPAALYFPNLLVGVLNLQTAVNKQALKGEGGEVYPINIFDLSQKSNIFLLLVMLGLSFAIYIYIKQKKEEVSERDNAAVFDVYVAFLFALMSLGGMIISSGRFLDYFFPAAILLFGSGVIFFAKTDEFYVSKKIAGVAFLGIAVFLLVMITNTFLGIKEVSSTGNFKQTGRVAEWIAEKSEDKELVYVYNWGYFPVAFFYNDKNVYSMGIEPRGLYEYSPELYWKWYNIFNNGMYCEKQEDCQIEKMQYMDAYKLASKEQKEEMLKNEQRKVIASIRNDFNSRFVIVNSLEKDVFASNEDLIVDSFEAKSQETGATMYGYELK